MARTLEQLQKQYNSIAATRKPMMPMGRGGPGGPRGAERVFQVMDTEPEAPDKADAASADAIMVLEHGEIIERGNHEQLLAQKGRYYELYTGQKELD